MTTTYTAKLDTTLHLTNAEVGAVDRAVALLNRDVESLDHAEFLLQKLFSATDGWFVYRGGSHVTLHRENGGARVLIVEERGVSSLTALETKVLDALRDSALACSGGDFALVEETRVKGVSRQALGGVLTSLQTKGLIDVAEPYYINSGWVIGSNGRPRRSKGDKVTQVTSDHFKK